MLLDRHPVGVPGTSVQPLPAALGTTMVTIAHDRLNELLWRVYVAYSCLRLQIESRHDLDGEDTRDAPLLPQLSPHV